MKNFLKALNVLGKLNVTGGEADEFVSIPQSEGVYSIDINNTQSRVLDFRNLFADNVGFDFGLVISKDSIMFEDGSIRKLKDVFSQVKADSRKIKPALFDFVDVGMCVNEGAVITTTNARSTSEYKSMRGIVKEVNDNIYTICVGGQTIKIPSVCLKRVPRTIMSKTMKDVYEFMINKGRNALILPEYNYMEISEDGKFIKYIATDRLSRFDGKFWDKDLRAKFATQKKIRGVLKALFDCNDEEMDAVIMLYGNSTIEVEVLEGADVRYVYDRANNHDSGTLGNSCMLDKPSSYFDIYEENAKVAIVKDDSGKIILRALIWELYSESLKRKIKILDRIYSKNDSMVPMIKNWAMKSGMYTIVSQTHSCKTMVSPKGAELPIGDFHVRLTRADYENFPYIDTFFYIVGNKAYASGYIGNAHNTGGKLSVI